MSKRIPIEERFWTKVNKDGPIPSYRPDLGPCWIWTASRNKFGYGKIGAGGSGNGWIFAYKVSYEIAKGPVPEGLELDHLCRVRHCVNPNHLEPVTTRENLLRGVGTSAINNQKTHCVNGHEFTEENTYHWPKKPHERKCKECMKFSSRKSMELNREKLRERNRKTLSKFKDKYNKRRRKNK